MAVAAKFANSLDLTRWNPFIPSDETEGVRANRLKLMNLSCEAELDLFHIEPRVIEALAHDLELVDLGRCEPPTLMSGSKLRDSFGSFLAVHLDNQKRIQARNMRLTKKPTVVITMPAPTIPPRMNATYTHKWL